MRFAREIPRDFFADFFLRDNFFFDLRGFFPETDLFLETDLRFRLRLVITTDTGFVFFALRFRPEPACRASPVRPFMTALPVR